MVAPAAAVNAPTQSICKYGCRVSTRAGNTLFSSMIGFADRTPDRPARLMIFSGITTCKIGSPQVAVEKKISPSGATSQPQVLQEPVATCSSAEPSGRNR